jgi:ATP/maltotriose-dependent transcriptional regulator MalT
VAWFAGDRVLTEQMVDEGLASPDRWVRAGVRMFRATIHENEGKVDEMSVDVDIALAEFRELGERWGLANTLRGKAMVLSLRGELLEAEAAYQEALDLMAQMRSREDEAFLLVQLGGVAMRRGDTAKARRLIERAWESAEVSGSPLESVFTLSMLAELELQGGEVERARSLHGEATRRMAAITANNPVHGHGQAIVLGMAARLAFVDGDLERAASLGREAYAAAVSTNDLPIVAAVGVLLADIAAECGGSALAAEILGASARLRGADDATSPDIARLSAALRAALGADEFARHFAQGKSLDREAALERLNSTEALSA